MKDIMKTEECDMPPIPLIRDNEEAQLIDGEEEEFSVIGWLDPDAEVYYFQLICMCCGQEHWRKEVPKDESFKNN